MSAGSLEGLILAAVLLLGMTGSLAASSAAGEPADGTAGAPQTAPIFSFHSSFWVHAHQALHYAATAKRPPPALAAPFPETAEWLAAVAYYRDHFSARGGMTLLFDGYLVEVNRHLSGLGPDELPPSALRSEHRRILISAAESMRQRWPSQDARNRAWIADLQPRIARHGAAIRDSITVAFRTPWPAQPVRVDVSCFAGPVGAYTVGGPIHTMISSCDENYAGDRGLEMLFHESSHPLFDGVERRLKRIASARSVELPRQLWHSILFYSVGRFTADAMGDGYITYAMGNRMWERRLPAQTEIARFWQSYLDGRTTMDEALEALVLALPPDA